MPQPMNCSIAQDIHHSSNTEGSVVTQDLADLVLHARDGPISNLKLLKAYPADTPIEELRKAYDEEGVVWIQNLLNRDDVLKCRSDYLSYMDPGTNMLKPGTDPVDGIFAGGDYRDFVLPGAGRIAAGIPNEGPFVDKSKASHDQPWYHEFRAKVAAVLEPLTGRFCGFEDPWNLPRSLLRSSVPGGEVTPVHYDQIFLRAGPPTSITAWIPIGDIELSGGGLIYLEKSHHLGKQYEAEFSAANASLPDSERVSAFNQNMMVGGWLSRNAAKFGQDCGKNWVVANYQAGDVVLHNPYTIHSSAKNLSPSQKIRVSTDMRFVDRSKPYDQRWTWIAYSQDDPNFAANSYKDVEEQTKLNYRRHGVEVMV